MHAYLLIVFIAIANAQATSHRSLRSVSAGDYKSMFTDQSRGSGGCTKLGARPTTSTSFKSFGDATVSIETDGMDCRSVSTVNTCSFDLGQNGVTKITFDFEVSAKCYTRAVSHFIDDASVINWFAFWLDNVTWKRDREVDLIESGQGASNDQYPDKQGGEEGLHINFAGSGISGDKGYNQAWYDNLLTGKSSTSFKSSENGVITVTSDLFDEAGVMVYSKTGQATAGLKSSKGYFFVVDTAVGGAPGCKLTIKNIEMYGTVPDNKCQGFNIIPDTST
mmetsp:Transcript_10068/g.16496  ORF Transcript_10068/g.16496 Transcript_10068/m.16496 type:complete len:278 (-) Transcript_10068:20-853(-)